MTRDSDRHRRQVAWNRWQVQRGFTLIELVAVMAILAILVAVVAPAVTSTRDASVRAQAQTDAKEVTNRITSFYGKQEGAEVRRPLTVAVGAVSAPETVAAGGVQQLTSSRWPEMFITEGYATEFQEVAVPATGVTLVTLRDKDNQILAQQASILNFTAIAFSALSGVAPATTTQKQSVIAPKTGDTAITVEVHDFLWLLEKTTSGSGLENDTRRVAVFQLTGTEIVEGMGQVRLNYKEILPGAVRATAGG